MDERPKWTPEELEALELFRFCDEAEQDAALAPTAEALKQDPALAQRLTRILQWDARLAESMTDVPTPPGLAEQILQRLEPTAPPLSTTAQPPAVRPRRRRFAWAALASGVAVAAVLIAAAILGNALPELDPGTLRSTARNLFEATQDAEPSGELLVNQAPPTAYPYSEDLIQVAGIRWRPVANFAGAEAVAYDIPLLPGQKATLYAVRCRSSSLPPAPPGTPTLQTQNLAIAAWQSDGIVYVVVVEGDEPAYRTLLQSTFHQLT